MHRVHDCTAHQDDFEAQCLELQDDFDLKGDYLRWRQKRGFAFAAHSFMYTPASKAELLRVENQLEMCACRKCRVLLFTIISAVMMWHALCRGVQLIVVPQDE
jgi:hypothetical protein